MRPAGRGSRASSRLGSHARHPRHPELTLIRPPNGFLVRRSLRAARPTWPRGEREIQSARTEDTRRLPTGRRAAHLLPSVSPGRAHKSEMGERIRSAEGLIRAPLVTQTEDVARAAPSTPGGASGASGRARPAGGAMKGRAGRPKEPAVRAHCLATLSATATQVVSARECENANDSYQSIILD